MKRFSGMKRFPGMVRFPVLLLAALPLLTANAIPSSPELGKAEGQCRPGEIGPAFVVEVVGLKDRIGRLKLEVYPGVDPDWLADDNVLIMAGKTFRRVEVPVPVEADPHLCIRIPGPGTYGLALLHERDGNHRFNWQHDGIGFSANPRLGFSQPRAARVAVQAGGGITTLRIVMNYRTGLLSFGPLVKNQ